MQTTRTLIAAITAFLPLLSACTTSRGNPATQEAASKPTTAGVVKIAAQSETFVKSEPFGGSSGSVSVRLPAHVAFRDGAVAKIGSPMAGRVLKVSVRSGDRVAQGDPLITLACPEAASTRQSLATAVASLREADAAYQRENRMMEEGVGVERDRIAAEVRLVAAQAEVDRAKATNALVGDGAGAELVLRSPLAGTVLEVRATAGASADPAGEPLLEVGDPRGLWVVADVSEGDLSLVREGASALVELNSVPSPLHARVISVGTQVSDGLRTAPVRLAFEEGAEALRPGMFGRAKIESSQAGPTLPVEAVLIKDGRESVVYIDKGAGTYERRVVGVGPQLDGRIEVVSGVTAGERVVVQGALLLDGAAERLL